MRFFWSFVVFKIALCAAVDFSRLRKNFEVFSWYLYQLQLLLIRISLIFSSYILPNLFYNLYLQNFQCNLCKSIVFWAYFLKQNSFVFWFCNFENVIFLCQILLQSQSPSSCSSLNQFCHWFIFQILTFPYTFRLI